MIRARLPIALLAIASLSAPGCSTLSRSWPKSDAAVERAGQTVVRRDIPAPVATNSAQTALAVDPPLAPSDFTSPQPVDVFIRRALIENRTVLAARFNLAAIRERIPQGRLEDPMLSNTIWPFPSNAPQYSLMGYMPWDTMLAQQFPWVGTLRLRGCAAAEDAKVALEELAAAELDVVMNVRKAYLDLYYSQRSVTILSENRTLAVDIVEIARGLLANGKTSRQDLLRGGRGGGCRSRVDRGAFEGW